MTEPGSHPLDVTRSAEGRTGYTAAQVAGARRALPNGWWGAALLIATESALFGTLLGTYYYLRFSTAQWPPAGIDPPSVALPLAITAGLVLTSVPVALAARAARAGRGGRVRALLLLALGVQAGYLAVQVLLFRDDLNTFAPQATAYGSIYFTMLAVHHLHVVVGLLLEAGVLVRLTRGLNTYRVVSVRVVAFYWHFVNALAILVVLTQLSPSL